MKNEHGETPEKYVERPNPRKNHPHVFDGVLISLTSSTLVMKGRNGKELSINLDEKTKSSTDGIECERMALRTGQKIRVFAKRNDLAMAIKIAALDKQSQFAPLA